MPDETNHIETMASLNSMEMHEMKQMHNAPNSDSSPVETIFVMRVMTGWIYMFDFGATTLPPVFVPQSITQ